MNKLAPLAFVILLALGGALWYLANGSLNAYVKSKIETTGQQLSQFNVLVESVDIDSNQGIGVINNIRFMTIDNSINNTVFQIAKIDFSIALESLNKTPMVITQMAINQPTLTVRDKAKQQNALEQLTHNLKVNLVARQKELSAAEQQLEPYAVVHSIVINEGEIISSTQNTKLAAITLPSLSNEEGHAISMLVGKVLLQSLTAMTEQASKIEQ